MVCQDSSYVGCELEGYASMRSFLQANDWGVHLAYGMVLRSLDPGRNAPHVQYETV